MPWMDRNWGSAVLGLYSANKSANAAENAAKMQADAATAAAQLQNEQFNTINQQQAPQRATGYNSLNQLGAWAQGHINNMMLMVMLLERVKGQVI